MRQHGSLNPVRQGQLGRDALILRRGSKAVVFPNVVESVRKYHGDQEYLVYSAAGEIIGTTESEVKLENCTVCTVSFLEKDR